ncbi:BZ3500_MvSof-1268-A1-R1_Chr5-1g07648 [Microbotryum saponariae]|uniref:BZ3500_MvSof-1268-A1-R1_Chr5-1g07648 protein n=1 Tax=Microbotryum saponariae TaxID=289078 RepID=A0A2X0LI73_9BASI|nr:BZ3500_MvSof-1268-A1-R1_Chr5-1g07648 [Microbotryum saponariae]SDA05519.1 BZ3501_MvSof-1269-A2-R1_Chr5-2g07472 [Microbotryum saponariae]
MSAPDRSPCRNSETSDAASLTPTATCTLPTLQGLPLPTATDTTTPLRHVHSLVISRLRDRLVKSNIQFDQQEVSATGLNFLFETVGGDLGTPESFAFASYERATTRHHLLSDQELARVLVLVESTSSDPNPPEDEHVTYVRSWALQVEELALLVEAWVQAGIAVPESWSWLVDAFAHEDPNKVIYVRYVGSTRGQTAYNRFIEDRCQRKTGIVGEFLGTLLEVAPRAYEHGKTFEIRNARLPSYHEGRR